VGHVLTRTERTEDVGRLERGRRTGRAGRERNVLEVHNERLALDEREREVDAAGVALYVAVALNVRHLGVDAVNEALGELADTLVVGLERTERMGRPCQLRLKCDGARKGRHTSISSFAILHASPSPATKGAGTVPLLSPRSCPPPWMRGSSLTLGRRLT
jgi:hypothetical protein